MRKQLKGIGMLVLILFCSIQVMACLTWVSFTATKNSCQADLAWSYSHCDPGVFIVEFSLDGTNWISIGKRNSTGPGGTTENYTFSDMNACPATNPNNPVQYRIRFIKSDGTSDYSVTRTVDMFDNCSCANNATNRCSGLSTSISGSATICASSSQTYTMSGGQPAVWSITSGAGLVTVNTNFPHEISIGNSSSHGQIVLSAVVFGCSTFYKTISVGTPSVANFPLMIYSGPGDENEVCMGDENIFYGDITPNSTITWTTTYASPGGISATGYGYDDLYLYMWKPNQTAIIRLDASNACGTTTYDFAFKTIDCSLRFMVTPNPTKGDINISIANYQAKGSSLKIPGRKRETANTSISKVVVYDAQRNIMLQQNYNSQSRVNLQNTNLKPGIYFVTVHNGDYKETHRILVQ